jgi:hypothetical protein
MPTALLTTQTNVAPLSLAVVDGVVYDALIAPEIATPFFFHWQVSGAVPLATTENVAVCPAATV